jgi:dipeptidyl aminopeptidase/acylaminoacyl peptidase
LAFAPQVPTPDIVQVEPLAPQLLPSRGIAVFLPNFRGSGGYGHAFMRANVRHSPGAESDDVVDGVEWLVRRGIADQRRLAIMGWSAGGEITAWAISHPGRYPWTFAAAVVGAATVDETSAFGEMYHPDLMLAYMGAAPWDEPARYLTASSIYVANRIHTPTLILQGAEDEAVPASQARELYRALQENGVPSMLALYPRQGHNFSEPALMRDAVVRTLAWLRRWIVF